MVRLALKLVIVAKEEQGEVTKGSTKAHGIRIHRCKSWLEPTKYSTVDEQNRDIDNEAVSFLKLLFTAIILYAAKFPM